VFSSSDWVKLVRNKFKLARNFNNPIECSKFFAGACGACKEAPLKGLMHIACLR
jgi:hypothetical protein